MVVAVFFTLPEETTPEEDNPRQGLLSGHAPAPAPPQEGDVVNEIVVAPNSDTHSINSRRSHEDPKDV